jgi:hypothetical protein
MELHQQSAAAATATPTAIAPRGGDPLHAWASKARELVAAQPAAVAPVDPAALAAVEARRVALSDYRASEALPLLAAGASARRWFWIGAAGALAWLAYSESRS